MRSLRLFASSLAFYWRTNAAVIAGVAVAVTVLSGALLVGDSVRGSLRDLVVARLGRTDQVLLAASFFQERLAADLRADPAFAPFEDVCPLVVLPGIAVEQTSGRRVSRVQIYGVDDRFWRFHHVAVERGPGARDILLSPSLARDLGASVGGIVLLRVERPSAIPVESLHGRKDDVGRTLRLTVRGVVEPADLGEFSLQPQQAEVRAAFVALRQLQQDLDRSDRVNALLLSARQGASTSALPALQAMIRRRADLEDSGLRLRELVPQQALAFESDAGLVGEVPAGSALAAASELGMNTVPMFTYVATSIRGNGREIPYSLVTAIDLDIIVPGVNGRERMPIVLNAWAARDLSVVIGDSIGLAYDTWEDPGRLVAHTASFKLAAVVPLAGLAADRDFAPIYPGITDSDNLRDWDPPFPIDLSRIRPVDEDYWRAHRTTPKAFIPLAIGQSLWGSRHGSLSSIRILPGLTPLARARERYAQRVRAKLDPFAAGLSVHDARADQAAASRGATDFGEYFAYFSAFLVASGLLLAALFFRLGVEQRGREVGLLRALGFTTSAVGRLLAGEALLLSLLGAAVGMIGAVAYGTLMMAGLRTWWVDAVGTTALTLHVTRSSLAAGAAGGVIASVACTWWTLRTLARVSERTLLAGQLTVNGVGASQRRLTNLPLVAAVGFGLLGVALLGSALAGFVDQTGAFFGGGTSLLVSCLCWLTFHLERPSRALLRGHGWWSISRLGFRNAAYRPGRSALSVAVIASATFILMSVDAFRRDDGARLSEPHSGTGGYSLLVQTLLPVVRDPNSPDGRQFLGLSATEGIHVVPFRVRPGDDVSCLNLYEPRNPRILAASPEFIAANRFAFRQSLSQSEEERRNPWRLLEHDQPDGSIPVIADANSLAYVLHRSVGDEIVLASGDRPLRLRVVAALADSVLQGELVMAERNFLKLFPEQEGFRLLLVDVPLDRQEAVIGALEERLRDLGAEIVPTSTRLAEFHRVENTYLSTFQTLGGLGLVLGTIGLATVLLRNVLERRRELALLGALGYRRAHLYVMILAENVLILGWGLASGAVCAMIAIAPAAAERGGRLPVGTAAWLLLFAGLATGLIASLIATHHAVRHDLLAALKAE